MNLFYNYEEKRIRAGWRLLLQFFMFLIFSMIFYFFLDLLPYEIDFFLNILAGLTAFTLSIWVAAKFLDKRLFKSLGLNFGSQWMKEFFIGTGMAAVAISAIFLIEFFAEWITFTGYGWEREGQILYPFPLLGYICGMILVGFYEELFSRGYQIKNMIEGFRGRLSPQQAALLAVLISSSIFGILHAGNPNATIISTINIIIAGAVLAVPYLVTGSLALSIGLHAAWNFFQGGIYGFPVSGMLTRSSLLQIREKGPDLFTGGNFGPEAGLMGIFGMIIILILFYFYTVKTSYPVELNATFKSNKSVTMDM